MEGRTEDRAQQEYLLWTEIETHRQQEETLWWQKSRIRWLKEGEKNTNFFHKSIIQRRMHNNIAFINNKQGEKLEKHEEIEKEFQAYFQEILRERTESRDQAIQKITQLIPKIITEDHNNQLLQPISMKEVEDAMAQLKEVRHPVLTGSLLTFFTNFGSLLA